MYIYTSYTEFSMYDFIAMYKFTSPEHLIIWTLRGLADTKLERVWVNIGRCTQCHSTTNDY